MLTQRSQLNGKEIALTEYIAKCICTNFDQEVNNIKYRNANAGYPKAFIFHTVVNSFLKLEKHKEKGKIF